jgi:hypothetical protein
MKKQSLLTIAAVLTLAAAFTFAGCSDKDQSAKRPGVVEQVVDTFADKLADNLVNARLANATAEDTASAVAVDSQTDLTGVSDMIILGSKIYAVHSKGVVIHDLADNSTTNLLSGSRLNAIAYYDGKIYVGGDKLYVLDGINFKPVDMQFEGTIYALAPTNASLLIGTDLGLYTHGIFGNDILMDQVSVSAIVPDSEGVWIGTFGQGLYRWDGANFKKRYLFRDPCLFDFVNALDFNYGHLYVGTDSGLFIFDGGAWETLTTGEGLPSNSIKSIDASGWVVLIATDSGVTSYFNGDVMPVKRLSSTPANVVKRLDQRIIAGTQKEGILMKSGPVLKTLVNPDNPDDSTRVDIFSLSF